MKQYRIQEIHGNLYYIISEDYNERLLAVLRGKMKIEQKEHPSKIPYRNPCCVGDYVLVNETDQEDSYPVIEEILPRKNMLVRASPYEIQPLGSNLDFAVLITSLKQPDLRSGFIDRFLIACYSDNIEPVIFFTKCDLLNPDQEEDIEFVKQSIYYKNILSYVYWDNLLQSGNREPLNRILSKIHYHDSLKSLKDFLIEIKEGTVLLAGQSGTGKSTLTNLIIGKEVQKTRETSKTTGKGRHTTTTSSLFPVNENLILIDTPGIKEWGLAHLTKREIFECYPEWKDKIGMCKFRNCEHLSQIEGCVIQEAIYQNILPEWRKENLEHILQSLDYYERIRPGDYKKPTGRFHNKFF
ncbi:MAG: putative ribosome biogenesis GTPase RsgA [Leptospiraceae bacterium]|nr:MAG: putative ribosome biogenesis GTPase RsgA [Leptospiraceae bacterium]